MNRLSALVLAAMMSVAIIPSAFAQDIGTIAASIGGPDFDQSLETLDSATSVTVQMVSSLGGERGPLDMAVADKADAVSSLRARVDSSTAATNALVDQGLTSASVVAISAAGDGAVTLYVDDMMSSGDMMSGEGMAPADDAMAPADDAMAPADENNANPAAEAGEPSDPGLSTDSDDNAPPATGAAEETTEEETDSDQ